MNDLGSSSGLFRLYGLTVEVQTPLDGLLAGWMPEGVGPPDLRIGLLAAGDTAGHGGWVSAYKAVDQFADGTPEFVADRQPSSGSIRLTYHDGVAFTVNADGTCVGIFVPDSVQTAELLPALLGPIMGVVMRQRGTVCLHASAIAMGDRAIALVGDSGAGKSTTAAALARRGHAVLSDDVVPVRPDADRYMAVPAYPKLRLWPESAAALMGSADALPPMMPGWSKRALDLAHHALNFQGTPLPLSAVYFLGPRQRQRSAFTDVAPADALMRLVSDSFASRAQTLAQRADEFQLLGKLVREVELRQVCASDDLSQLDDLCEAIEADARRERNRPQQEA